MKSQKPNGHKSKPPSFGNTSLGATLPIKWRRISCKGNSVTNTHVIQSNNKQNR